MKINGYDFNVVYVDSAAVGTGDGSTPTDAMTTFPTQAQLTDGTVYLLRRDDSVTMTENIILTTISNVAILSMPLSSDPLYLETPTEAKTAWDSDASVNHEIYFNSGNRRFSLTTVFENIIIRNVDFRRNPNTNAGNTSSASFSFQGSDGNLRNGNVTIEGCKFYDTGRDFSDPSFVDTSPPAVCGFSFHARYITNYSYVNNKFVSQSRYNNSLNNNKFYMQDVSKFRLENNEIWQYSFANGTTDFCYVHNSCYESVIKNNNMYLYMTSVANVRKYFSGYNIRSMGAIIENNNIEMAANTNNPTEDITAYQRYLYKMLLVYCDGSSTDAHINQRDMNATFIVKSFNVNVSGYGFQSGDDGGNALCYLGTGYNQGSTVQNNPINGEMEISDINLNIGHFDYNDGLAASDCFYSVVMGAHLKNINVNHDTTSGRSVYVNGAKSIEGMNVNGRMQLHSCGIVDVDSFVYESGEATNRIHITNSIVRFKDIKLRNGDWGSSSWLRTQSIGSSNGDNSRVIIDNCDSFLIHTNSNETTYKYGIWCNNIKNIAGAWTAVNRDYTAKTWGINRNGGAGSIKFDVIGSNQFPLEIGPRPYSGIIQDCGGLSNGVVTVYIAYTAFSSGDIGRNFVIDVDSKQLDGSIKTTSSIVEGVFIEDVSSTWTDPNVEKAIIKIPFKNHDITEDLQLRMRFLPKEGILNNSIMYLDPVFTVAAT